MIDTKPTILLVEDDEDDVFAMRRALKLAHVSNHLEVVADGQQALDYLSGTGGYSDRANHPLPFIIFLDLKLPYLDGFEILSWIRQQPALESIAVVVLTGSAEIRDKDRAYALGARSYLTKPPATDVLHEVFDSLKSYWVSKGRTLPVTSSPPSGRAVSAS